MGESLRRCEQKRNDFPPTTVVYAANYNTASTHLAVLNCVHTNSAPKRVIEKHRHIV